MQLSGSNYGMPALSLDAALAFHAEVGFRAIEITVLPNYATALSAFDRDGRRQARELLGRHGIVCSGIANFQTLTDPNSENTATLLANHRAAIDLAVDLATGPTPPVVAFFSGGSVEDWFAARNRLVDRVAALAEYAHGRGVVMAMKAHALGCVSRPYQLVDLFEQVGSPSLRFCFDMSHFEVQGLSIEQAMYPLIALSAHVEVKASVGRAPNQEYMIPGEPNTQSDFITQFKTLRALGYRGFIVPEMSVHVMRRPNYDQFGALRLAYQTLTTAMQNAGANDA